MESRVSSGTPPKTSTWIGKNVTSPMKKARVAQSQNLVLMALIFRRSSKAPARARFLSCELMEGFLSNIFVLGPC